MLCSVSFFLSFLLAFNPLNSKFEVDSSVRSQVKRGLKISKLGHVTSARALGVSCVSYAGSVHPVLVYQIWSVYLDSFESYKGVPKFWNWVISH